MKNTITTLILASLVFSGCVNSTKQNTQQNEVICEIHHLNCNKLAKDENMSLDEYHKWQEEQKKAAQDEDKATDENGDIVGPEDEDDGRFVHIENDDDVASNNNIGKQDEEDGLFSFGRTQSIEKLKRISRECLYCGKKLTYGNTFYITSQGINGSRVEGIDCQNMKDNPREYNDKWSLWYDKYFCCKICIRAYHRDKNIELRD
jgi:hypothetical protein